jgi:hypothetical protein
MRHRVLSQFMLLILIVSTDPHVAMAGGEAARSGSHDRPRFTLADGNISFLAPLGFTALTPEWLAAKYPKGGAPRQAVGNARRTTSIAYDLLDQRVPSNDLDALRRSIQESFSQLPKLKWIASDVRRVGGRDWAYVEFTAAAADQDIHNIILLSVYHDRPLLFNFNSTVTEFPRLEHALRGSMASITTKP